MPSITLKKLVLVSLCQWTTLRPLLYLHEWSIRSASANIALDQWLTSVRRYDLHLLLSLTIEQS